MDDPWIKEASSEHEDILALTTMLTQRNWYLKFDTSNTLAPNGNRYLKSGTSIGISDPSHRANTNITNQWSILRLKPRCQTLVSIFYTTNAYEIKSKHNIVEFNASLIYKMVRIIKDNETINYWSFIEDVHQKSRSLTLWCKKICHTIELIQFLVQTLFLLLKTIVRESIH